MKSHFKILPIESLQRGRYQPRVSFAEDSLQELADSIKSQGLIEPLVVRELALNRYEIIAGERRYRAAILIGLSEVPCMIGNYTDEQAAAVTLIENIQRQELNLLEEAGGYRRLFDEFHFQQDEIALLVGKSRSHIANILRLLSLEKEVQAYIREEKLSLGHARMLVGLPAKTQIEIAEKIDKEGWSVRFLEKKVKELKTLSSSDNQLLPDKDIEHLKIKIAEQMGAPVEITQENGSGGWLKIKFYDNDTLSGLLERMGLGYD